MGGKHGKPVEKLLPETLEEAIRFLIGCTPPAELEGLRRLPETDVRRKTRPWQMAIRDRLGLWGKNGEIMESMDDQTRRRWAENASELIVMNVWRRLNYPGEMLDKASSSHAVERAAHVGVVREFLTLPVIEHESGSLRFSLAKPVKPLPTSKLRTLFQQPGAFEPNYPMKFEASWQSHDLMQLAALEHARGTDSKAVRAIYRQAAEQWEPIIPAMDFKPRTYEIELGDSPRLAADLKAGFKAKVTKVGREYHVKYRARPQPLSHEVLHEALICAAISHDPVLAKRLAKGYDFNPVDPMWGDDRFMILRHLLAEDDRAAADIAKRLKPGYPADWPPELIEFPLGVLRRDPKLLAKGLRTLNARFKGRWDVRRWRARYEKITSGPRPRYRGKWEDMLKDVRGFLISMKWILSPYALAFLNVAAWRGMTSPFDQPRLFSDWVPLSLCRRPVPAMGDQNSHSHRS